MKNQLVNNRKISISNFTFDDKTQAISFFSTKTNKCWSHEFFSETYYGFKLFINEPSNQKQVYFNRLKKLCKNGNS